MVDAATVAIAARVSTREPVAGDALLHPVPLAAIVLLIVNDHVLKQAFPGALTGKLSDFAGLVFFPLFLQALWEVGNWAVGRRTIADRRVLVAVVVATGLFFASIKLVPAANHAASEALGTLQWLVGLLPALALGWRVQAPVAVQIALDPTDLIALPALLVAYIVGVRRTSAGIGQG